jgi:hypothetical protein
MGVATTPYIQVTPNKMSRLLLRFNIKTIHIPIKQNTHFWRPAQQLINFKDSRILARTTVYMGRLDLAAP